LPLGSHLLLLGVLLQPLMLTPCFPLPPVLFPICRYIS
jgi:hypothetical protein